MSIEFRCLNCNKLLRVPETSAGKKARCPECESIQAVPVQDDPQKHVAGSSEFASFANQQAAAPRAPASDNPFTVQPTSNPFADGASSKTVPVSSSESVNPYAAPVATKPQLGGGGVAGPMTLQLIRTRVEGPATALMVVSGIVIVLSVFAMAAQLIVLLADAPDFEVLINLASGAGGIVLYGVVMAGAIQMKQLQSYGLAVTASILAMLPCSGCCIIGLPIGIWALVVLCDPSVRAAFR
jgi:phage FluMu protein Com